MKLWIQIVEITDNLVKPDTTKMSTIRGLEPCSTSSSDSTKCFTLKDPQSELTVTLEYFDENVLHVRVNPIKENNQAQTFMIEKLGSLNLSHHGVLKSEISLERQKTMQVKNALQPEGVFELQFGNLKTRIFTKNDFRIECLDARTNQVVFADADFDAYQLNVDGDNFRHVVKCDLANEHFFGYGECAGPLNKAKMRLRVDARDAMGYDASSTDPLYKHWPYGFTIQRHTKRCYGLLYDTMRRSTFDLGKEISAFRGQFRYFETRCSQEGLDYYVILGEQPSQVSQGLRDLIGPQCLPPLWSLGYLGSSMAYTESENAMERLTRFLDKLDEEKIPCDGFHLSSGYTTDSAGRRCVFQWNTKRIPNPQQMFNAFNSKQVKVIANIKPWLLKEHPQFEEVKQMGGFFKSSNQNDVSYGRFWLGGAGTSGLGCYMDFANERMFDWWKSNAQKSLLELGCAALWNDNNEYEVDESEAISAIGGGQTVEQSGRAVHTQLMARASYAALKEQYPNEDVLVVSRSGSIGTHRYAAQTWSGDNSTSWETMRFNISMCLGLGLCGWAGSGPDVGGFAGERPDEEMFVRWVQCGVLMPRFSIHSSVWKTAQGSADAELSTNEPWMYPKWTEVVRRCIQLRYHMRKYIYSLYLEHVSNGSPVARPLLYHYPYDRIALNESFTFLLGRDLLVAPIVHPTSATDSFSVYLPKGDDWINLNSAAQKDGPLMIQGGEYFGGSTTKQFALDGILKDGLFCGIPLFLRIGGGFIMENSNEESSLLIAYLALGRGNKAEFSWRESVDDGVFVVAFDRTSGPSLRRMTGSNAKRTKRELLLRLIEVNDNGKVTISERTIVEK